MGNPGDFTEREYRALLRLARERYRFVRFDDALEAAEGSVLWRHDIDFSVHRALALALIEADEGVTATYFVNLHSPFYNALEPEVAERVEAIVELGHDLGVHFDPTFYATRGRGVEEALADEHELLAMTFGVAAPSFSVHNPDIAGWHDERDEVQGLVNTHGATLKARYGYVSDSNGIWRHRRLRDVLEAGEDSRLHVLTHPEWWAPEPLTPRDRLARCIDGRAAAQWARYERTMAAMGRPAG